MILYYTSHRPSVVGQGKVIACPHGACRLAGFGEAHLCFTTEPLTGSGQWVFSADVPQNQIEKYEYTNETRAEKVRFFALPRALVQSLDLKQDTFEQVTGRPWNKWVITILDRRAGRRAVRGSWSLLWGSREGVVGAKVYRRTPEFMSIQVETTVDFDPETDYLVCEVHEEQEKAEGGVKETWRLETLAGITPQWALFPQAWQKWVWDRKVTNSAIRYILTHVPQVNEQVEYAMQKDSKHNKARAWRNVSDEVGRSLSRKLGAPIDLGKLAAHSWTAVAAMPHRIANRMSQHLPYAAWEPPMPQPIYQSPEESGRHLVANLYGVFPTHGPGVDHAPQDRPFTGREGELVEGPLDPFDTGQRAPASLLVRP